MSSQCDNPQFRLHNYSSANVLPLFRFIVCKVGLVVHFAERHRLNNSKRARIECCRLSSQTKDIVFDAYQPSTSLFFITKCR